MQEAQEASAASWEPVSPEIKDGWLDFDVMIATPDQMGQIGRLGRVLDPRGHPNRSRAPSFDVGTAVRESKGGKIEFRVDKGGNVHAPIGKVSFAPEQLETNFSALMDTIVRAKPAAAKGLYIRNVAISSSMGPGVTIDTTPFR